MLLLLLLLLLSDIKRSEFDNSSFRSMSVVQMPEIRWAKGVFYQSSEGTQLSQLVHSHLVASAASLCVCVCVCVVVKVGGWLRATQQRVASRRRTLRRQPSQRLLTYQAIHVRLGRTRQHKDTLQQCWRFHYRSPRGRGQGYHVMSSSLEVAFALAVLHIAQHTRIGLYAHIAG